MLLLSISIGLFSQDRTEKNVELIIINSVLVTCILLLLVHSYFSKSLGFTRMQLVVLHIINSLQLIILPPNPQLEYSIMSYVACYKMVMQVI